ncbi:MAG: MarR family transcriptional regulator [Burkholderiaceae bacterium]
MDIETHFSMTLGRVSRRWRARLDERLRHLGLTQARWHTLLRLDKEGPMPQHQLAESLQVERPTLVRLLDGLERQGLVERRPVEDDRRVRCVHLTEKARPLLEEISYISGQLRHELLAEIDHDALMAAIQVLQELDARLEKG